MGGNKAARSGLQGVVSTILHGGPEGGNEVPKPTSGVRWMEQYRVWLFGSAEEINDGRTGRTLRRGLKREKVDAVLRSGGKLSRWELLRSRLRYMTRGGAIGSKAFVETIFNSERWRFDPDRQAGARTPQGGDAVWKGLRTLIMPRPTGT